MKLKSWKIISTLLDKNKINFYESIFSLSNGFIGIRGVEDEPVEGQQDGIYINGIYSSKNEVVNFPQFLQLLIFANKEKFNLIESEYKNYTRILNLKTGTLSRELIWKTKDGEILIKSERFVSQINKYLVCQKYYIKSVNFKGNLDIRPFINLNTKNFSGKRYRVIKTKSYDKKTIFFKLQIKNNYLYILQSCSYRFNNKNSGNINVYKNSYFKISENIQSGDEIILYRWTFIGKNLIKIFRSSKIKKQYEYYLKRNIKFWAKKWNFNDIKIEGPGEDQCGIRYSIFQLLQHSTFLNGKNSIGAKGLTGEHYNNHIFWDTEIFLLPFYLFEDINTARKLLLYRYNTKEGAINNAIINKNRGIRYPWESAENGTEACPKKFYSPELGKYVRIFEGEQEIHITADVLYAIWKYFEITNDKKFLLRYFADIILLSLKFWESILIYHRKTDSYETFNVIGPDEYHRSVNNNFYTNYLIKQNLIIGLKIITLLQKNLSGKFKLMKHKIDKAYISKIKDIAKKIKINYDYKKEIYEQFDGFFRLKKLNKLLQNKNRKEPFFKILGWENIYKFKIIKQADVLMAMFLFRKNFPFNIIKKNWHYYVPYTAHDSSLSNSIHSIIAAWIGKTNESYKFFKNSLFTDLKDTKHNTNYGLHSATWGGNWQSIILGFAGMNIKNNKLCFNPALPKKWNSISFKIYYNKRWHNIELTKSMHP